MDMEAKLRHLLMTLEKAKDMSALQSAIMGLRDHYKVAHIAYHWVSADGGHYGCGTYPTAWVQHYIDQDYLRIDPVVQGCFQHFHPVDWKALNWSSKAATAFRGEAIAAGVGNQGYSIPLRGPRGQFALFSLTDSATDAQWAAFTEIHWRDLLVCAHSFNQKALEFGMDRLPVVAKPLSPREVDVLTLLAMGYSRGRVAQRLSISEHTLRAYVETARFKLGAANTMQAVARAVSEGLIIMGRSGRTTQEDWNSRAQAAE